MLLADAPVFDPGNDVHPAGGYGAPPVIVPNGVTGGGGPVDFYGNLASTGTDTFTVIFLIVLGLAGIAVGIGVLLWARRR